MKVTRLSTILITDKFEEMKRFYLDVLQQEIEDDFGNCISFKGGLSIWELRPKYPLAERLGKCYDTVGNKNLEIGFDVDDFDDTVTHIKKSRIKYLHDVVEETWGQRTMRFYDPENNLIEVGESIPSFSKRLFKELGSEQKVADKTGIPVEAIKEYIN